MTLENKRTIDKDQKKILIEWSPTGIEEYERKNASQLHFLTRLAWEVLNDRTYEFTSLPSTTA